MKSRSSECFELLRKGVGKRHEMFLVARYSYSCLRAGKPRKLLIKEVNRLLIAANTLKYLSSLCSALRVRDAFDSLVRKVFSKISLTVLPWRQFVFTFQEALFIYRLYLFSYSKARIPVVCTNCGAPDFSFLVCFIMHIRE